jgi:hypothetical protein
MEEDLGQTELDTFKILSNSDMVDWSRRAPDLRRNLEPDWGGDTEEGQEESVARMLSQQVRSAQGSSVQREGSGSLLRDEILNGQTYEGTPFKNRETGYRRSISHSPPLPKSRSQSPPEKKHVYDNEVHINMENDENDQGHTKSSLPRRSHAEEEGESGEARREEGYSETRQSRDSDQNRDTSGPTTGRRFSTEPRTTSETRSPPAQMPKRVMPQPKKYTAAEENDDYEIKAEKEGLLHELHTFSRPPHNIKMTREWDINVHTLDELQYELDRINSELSANGIVDMAKSGIKFGVSGLEMFLKQQGIDSVDGWYNNSCKDMSKFNRPLLRLYKKYWRNTNLSPMMELGYLLAGGLVWTIAENKMGFKKSASAPSGGVGGGAYEATASDKPAVAKMRPPSNSNFSIPKWGAETTSSVMPATVAAAPHTANAAPAVSTAEMTREPVTIVAPPPVPSGPSEIEKQLMAKQQATEEALQKMSSENSVMIQMLQNLAKTQVSSPKNSPRSSARNSPREIRLPMGKRSTKKTPKINFMSKEEDEALSL